MRANLISVPYDSGRRGWRMGAGPAALLHGMPAFTDVVEVETHDVAGDVLRVTLDLADAVRRAVFNAREAGRLPVVLAGNCFMTLGAMMAVQGDDTALAWLDAHGDANTPDTSTSGFLDGMSAAAVLGWWNTGLPYRPLPVGRLLLIGTRDLDAPEAHAIDRLGVHVLPVGDVAHSSDALDHLCRGARGVWVHLDLDVLDPATVGNANMFAAAGGLRTEDVAYLIRELAARVPLAGLTVSAYDPAADADGRVRAAATSLIDVAVASAARPEAQ